MSSESTLFEGRLQTHALSHRPRICHTGLASRQDHCLVQRSSCQLVVCHESGDHSAASKLASIHNTLCRHGTCDVSKVENDFADSRGRSWARNDDLVYCSILHKRKQHKSEVMKEKTACFETDYRDETLTVRVITLPSGAQDNK